MLFPVGMEFRWRRNFYELQFNRHIYSATLEMNIFCHTHRYIYKLVLMSEMKFVLMSSFKLTVQIFNKKNYLFFKLEFLI